MLPRRRQCESKRGTTFQYCNKDKDKDDKDKDDKDKDDKDKDDKDKDDKAKEAAM